ncbi:MFS transporter [Bordetella genomosp. 12]|uniref:MFS transporter n=1 Tax=Bordetella genomosp. 12 TaxID=463035 RepID=A0A261VD23_9BORD|nr:MFS transporter [Bordetella genomosp. 12]OZI72036.1 MFS transporter [Bordetella genomosp. 12]
MPAASAQAPLPSALDASLLATLAAACGVFVASIYFNQPLLELLLQAFPHDAAIVNLIPTATQLGFACGLLLLVPLGDRVNRRHLILCQSAGLCLALAGLSLAPAAWSAALISVCVGIGGSVAQQIVPLAAELAHPQRRGQVVGTVMSGLLCGILLGRVVGGFAGEHWGWRAAFGLGAAACALMWLILLVKLPSTRPQTTHRYGELMRSLRGLWRSEPQLRRATRVQALLFGAFIGMWTILALYLDQAFGLGADVAGLMGVVGAAGILMAPLAGRIADRRGPHSVIALGVFIMLVSFVILGAWASLIGLVVGILLVDIGEQAAMIANQHVVYALRPEARSRLNTLYMTGMFLGAAAGSWGAGLAWHAGGWKLACLLWGVLCALAWLVHARGRPAPAPATGRHTG